ncbi:MAG: GPP34 family phosphoprotein [Calditrichaeota bacterium]|nr:GPP34 family phosphoprotein [Calditrichota bacterium]
MNKTISVDNSNKKKLLNIQDNSIMGEPLLEECRQKIANAKRRASITTWVSRFAGVKNLKHRIAGELVKKGILRADEDKVLLVFSRKIYPELNPEPERKIIDRLHKAIFEDNEDFDARTVVLLSLANSADLLRLNFDKKKLKSRKKRIEKIVNGELAGKAAKEAIEAVQVAIMVAAIMPTIITTTVATS